MKKAGLLVMLLGLVLLIPGCGFTEGKDAVVTVVKATPTPEPTPTPEVTPTPEPTPTPEVVYEQSPSGLNVEVKSGTYTTNADVEAVNLRNDASVNGTTVIVAIPPNTTLTSTGICQTETEGVWIRVEYNGQIGFVSGEFVTEVPQDAAPAENAEADVAG